MSKSHNNPWLWIPVLYISEAIPIAMVTYVSILMFLQLKAGDIMSTILSSLLFIPWALGAFTRDKLRKSGLYGVNIRTSEIYVFLCLLLLAFLLNSSSPHITEIFLALFGLSLFCSWHKTNSHLYFMQKLYPREQQFYQPMRTISSQVSTIITYGLLIILVGTLQVYFKNLNNGGEVGWSIGCYMLAGIFFIGLCFNLWLVSNPEDISTHYESLDKSVIAEFRRINAIREKPYFLLSIISLFLILLPQALMFFVRVIYLYTSKTDNGLGCSMQDIGFAQGTIGSLAFAFGLISGRKVSSRFGANKAFWWQAISLGLSPFYYLLMTTSPPKDMTDLCIMTFLTQLCFGFGLNICMVFVSYLSGDIYKYFTDYMLIPIVSGVMILPMLLSGCLKSLLDFHAFFMVCCICSVVSWIFLLAFSIRSKFSTQDTCIPREG